MTLQIDNTDLKAKLALRISMLEAFHGKGKPRMKVLDCCQGGGVIWDFLRKYFPVSQYLPLDRVARKGRLQTDVVRYLVTPGWDHDVVDIDVYGAPWNLWQALLATVTRPLTVFLTIGSTNFHGSTNSVFLKSAGIAFSQQMPISLCSSLSSICTDYCLAMALDHCSVPCEVWEIPAANSNMRYLGIRLDGEINVRDRQSK